MNELRSAWGALQYGGAMIYPLLFLGVIAVLIILDRAVAYYRCLRLPRSLLELVETYGFSWDELDRQLTALAPVNAYRRFFEVISDNRHKPAWLGGSRARDEAADIEKSISRGLWLLETVVTVPPLMALPRTITLLLQAFKVIRGSGLVS